MSGAEKVNYTQNKFMGTRMGPLGRTIQKTIGGRFTDSVVSILVFFYLLCVYFSVQKQLFYFGF